MDRMPVETPLMTEDERRRRYEAGEFVVLWVSEDGKSKMGVYRPAERCGGGLSK